jgi:hypothetical protein
VLFCLSGVCLWEILKIDADILCLLPRPFGTFPPSFLPRPFPIGHFQGEREKRKTKTFYFVTTQIPSPTQPTPTQPTPTQPTPTQPLLT